MSNEQEYKVLREHEGDRFYKAGETRTLAPADAKHLVKLGTLSGADVAEEKAETAPLNKMEPAPENKQENGGEATFTDAPVSAGVIASTTRRSKS